MVSLSLHRCLSPDPGDRPTATELRAVLAGKATAERDTRTAPSALPSSGARKPIASNALELQHAHGRSLQIRVRTELTRSLMEQLGPEAHFWDLRQCVLDRNSQDQWVLAPIANTVNETLLNGQAITGPILLREGDMIAVGRSAKGIVKMPVVVRGR